jgi:hypothetical protein
MYCNRLGEESKEGSREECGSTRGKMYTQLAERAFEDRSQELRIGPFGGVSKEMSMHFPGSHDRISMTA